MRLRTIQEGKIMVKKGKIAALVCAVACAAAALPAYASGTKPVPAGDSTASLTVEVEYPSKDGKSDPVPIAGAEISIYRIAELTDAGEYQITEAYEGAGIQTSQLYDADASSMKAISETFSSYVKKANLSADLGPEVTGKDGKAYFGNITDLGMYLVVQTGKTKDAEKYTEIEPYLVQIPMPPLTDGSSEGWTMDVTSYPKAGDYIPEEPGVPTTPPVPKPPAPETPPPPDHPSLTRLVKTGDDSAVLIWIVIAAGAAVALFVGVTIFRKGKDELQK